MKEKKYVVYKHTSPSGKCYIGITCKKPEQRWRNGNGYKKQQVFYRAIVKYGWDNFEHEILEENLSHKEANRLEQMLIEKNKCQVPNGYNITKGGDGTVGVKWNENQKNAVYKWNNSNKCRQILVTRNKEMSKPIFQYNSEGNFIKAHSSFTEASIELGVSIASISTAIKNNTLCCDNQWRKIHRNKISKYKPTNTRAVVKIDTNTGEILQMFDTITQATKDTGVENISNCCNKKGKTAGGFGWRYAEDTNDINIDDFIKRTTGKQVNQIDKNSSIIIHTFNSMHEADRVLHISYKQIHKVCKGISKTAGGYIWKYAE